MPDVQTLPSGGDGEGDIRCDLKEEVGAIKRRVKIKQNWFLVSNGVFLSLCLFMFF